ncbi:unnamed protein product [Lactuca saligna]|uniref:Bicarbonate transporter-like transmembrane domain-containing protein n=1 Tax=Lactuca saligna TaxID=75948 RepID=A0AA35ZL82_LACSI|nr:unnamed protein product [Lactuca saligna]
MEVAVEQAAQSCSRRSKWQFMGTSDACAKEELHRVYCVSDRTEGNSSLGNASSFQKSLVFCVYLPQKVSDSMLFSRTTWEGGQYNRDEKSRLDALCLAMELGADHIDVEFQVPFFSLGANGAAGHCFLRLMYSEFYKKTFDEFLDPLAHTHFTTESLGVIVNNQTVIGGGRSISGVNISNEEQASVSVAVPSIHETEGGSASLGPTYRDSFIHYKGGWRRAQSLENILLPLNSYNFFHRKGLVPLFLFYPLHVVSDIVALNQKQVQFSKSPSFQIESKGRQLFLAWAGWVCVWTVVMLCVLPILDAYTLITRFTRVSGELFGMLISVFFMQKAIKGVIRDVPPGVPKRLFCPLPWEPGSLSHWTVIKVPAVHIFTAIIPALMIASLYFFDDSVVAQMAQQKEFNLKNPSAYPYDILLLGFMTLICGLVGVPPSNGVLPQSPMHTRSLATLERQIMQKKMVKIAKEGKKMEASSLEIYGKNA